MPTGRGTRPPALAIPKQSSSASGILVGRWTRRSPRNSRTRAQSFTSSPCWRGAPRTIRNSGSDEIFDSNVAPSAIQPLVLTRVRAEAHRGKIEEDNGDQGSDEQ